VADETRRTLELETITAQPQALSQVDYRLEDKISGALLGGAIADAMGWATEFLKSPKQLEDRFGVSRLEDFVSWHKQSGGRFNAYIEYIAPGDYSDDTQLTLAVARSILTNGRCDVEYFSKVELPLWLGYARGAGATIIAASKALSQKNTRWCKNFFSLRRGEGTFNYTTAGANGAAMRVAPLAMVNPHSIELLAPEVWRNAIVTHGHPRAIVGALVYARAVAYILATPSPQMDHFLAVLRAFVGDITLPRQDPDLASWASEWNSRAGEDFEAALAETRDEMRRFLDIIAPTNKSRLYEIYDRLGCFAPATKGSGTATVAAALAVFLRHGGTFEHAIIEAINTLGSDTDTIAAMAGTLAGAHAGYSSIPEKWATKMQDFPYFVRVASALARICERRAVGPELRHELRSPSPDIPDVTSLRGADLNLRPGQRVKHPVFALGSVTNIDVQPLRRRSGGKMLFLHVAFDCGQSCKFKFFSPEPTDRYTVQRRPRITPRRPSQRRLFDK
jgi:ADP-ribosylglycohydrolase